jgi:amino acid adenylation domain-containing protein
MWIREQADGLNIAVDYCTDLFEEDTIRRMMGHYERLLREAARDIEMRVSELRMLSGEEERQQLEEFGQGPRIAYPRDRTIVELLAEQAKRTPEKEAVRCGEQRLSYRELEERSSQLGHYLRRMGVREETLVPVCLERSIGMIVAILGILKAGGAYVPIDVNHPRERNGYILEDIGLGLLIVEDRTVDRLDTSGWEVINLDRIECESGEQGAWRPRGDDLAYVLYTSGTTGRPKGVMIRHSSLYNFILGMTTLLQAGEEMVMLSVTTYSFDISGLEFYLPLSVGGRLEVASESTLQDVERLRAEIAASGATHMQATPSRWQLLWESGWRNETGVVVLSGGEAISNRLKELLTGVSGEGIWNLYGPTETTIWSAACRLKSGDGITIGRPIANTGVYILDKAMRLMPVGGYGDLYISGAGLSTGYYRREELTGEKFVPNPYARAGHETLYKTGDLARWRPDGRLEFAGRQDYQVKIRGYRIELEEIENTLRAYKNIDQAVVAAQQGKEEEKYLVAYMVAGTVLDRTAVRSYVAEKLPSYMVPDYFVQLEAFPLTPNGKVDRKSLPLTAPGHQEEIQGPANVQEERLLTIWSELLTIDCQKIGVLNDFFTIGGNSIKAFHLDYQIHRCFGKKLGLRAVFEHRTIRKMAMLLRGADETRPEYVPEAPKRKYYPASSAQERIYYEWLQRKDSLAYNISGAWYIEKDSLETTLGDYLRVLVDRHPALRTSFTLTDAGVVQEVHSGGRIDLAVISAHEEDDLEAVFSDFVQPFDLSSPALIRFALVKQGGNKGCLLVDVHHIVCDGISLNILMEDFKYAIQGMAPKPLERSFVDYACWQRSAHPRLLEQRAFWQNVLADPPPVPDLAEETIDNDEDITKADVIQLVIQGPLYEKIKTFVSVEEASGFTLLLSVYYLLIYKISGNTDIIIGSDAIGRTQPAVRQIVGTFVNILPLRVRIDTDEDFRTFLRTVRETVLLAYENQEFPFDEMGVADVVPVHFSFMNYFDREASFRLNGLTFRPANLQKERTTQYGFKVQVLETGDGYIVEFVYSKARFKRETIELFTQYFENILTMAMEQPSVKLGDINS